MSPFDKANVGALIAGHGDWFTAQLVRLIVKADPDRRALLALGFPEEVAAVEAWQSESIVVAGEPT